MLAGYLIGWFVQIGRCGVQTQRDGVRYHGVADLEALLLVGFEHVGETETLTAHIAGVRLLARVSAPVSLHVGPARETLSTDLTDIWFLSCVSLHVLIKVLLHVEVLPTPLAHELLVSDMDAHV